MEAFQANGRLGVEGSGITSAHTEVIESGDVAPPTTSAKSANESFGQAYRRWTFYLRTEVGMAYFLNIGQQTTRSLGHAVWNGAPVTRKPEASAAIPWLIVRCSIPACFFLARSSRLRRLRHLVPDLAVPDPRHDVERARRRSRLALPRRGQHGDLHRRWIPILACVVVRQTDRGATAAVAQ